MLRASKRVVLHCNCSDSSGSVSDVTLPASRWQMHQVPRSLLQKLTFAVTKFDDALGGGNVALLAPPHLVQGVLVFSGARASVVADMVCNEEKMSSLA